MTSFDFFELPKVFAQGTPLLAAIRVGSAGIVFEAKSQAPISLAPQLPVKLSSSGTIGGGRVHMLSGLDSNTVPLEGDAGTLEFLPQQQDRFAGKRCVLAFRNHETAVTTADWLDFHAKHHGAQAALIVDRSTDRAFFQALKKQAKSCGMDVLIVQSPMPLGDINSPNEAHPFCCVTAPGKDRMDVPDPDPQRAPLAEFTMVEVLRHLFLNQAKSLLSLDVCDLLPATEKSVFKMAEDADTGVINLTGELVFPWRVRKQDDVHFADHICHQFDTERSARRWCIAPAKTRDAVWRFVRIAGGDPTGDPVSFFRFMGLKHPHVTASKIAPKSSLVRCPELLDVMKANFDHKPVPMPTIKIPDYDPDACSTAIVTTMKNEGPFILEWIAFHKAIGVERFLVYTNDCTDGTDTLLDVLDKKGIVQHRENPFKGTDLKPQHAALQAAEEEEIMTSADWVICMDVDEYLNIKVGNGQLKDLYAATGDANMISCTWRLFGNANVHAFHDGPIISQFNQCAEELTRKPHQAWGFKTLFRNVGIFKKMGVHRPKGLNPQLWEEIRWVNGSGRPMPRTEFRNAWRSTSDTYGYDLVSLNHYAVRSAESFLVKRDRGRVNHVDRDQGLAYWFRMNNNSVTETSIQRMLPALRAEMDKMLADPEIAACHAASVKAHADKIAELRASEKFSKFYEELTGPRMERLSQMHNNFGANVFLAGPEVVPDKVVFQDHPEGFFFTVDDAKTKH